MLFKILNQEGIEKNLIATNLMVAGDSRVGKVSDGLLEKNGLQFVDSSICNSCEQQTHNVP